MAKTTTSFALSDQTKSDLKDLAELLDRSQAWVIEKLVAKAKAAKDKGKKNWFEIE